MKNKMPSERSTYADFETGATVVQWTRGPHKNQHLYFTSPSVTADGRWLVFLSDRSGSPNLFAIDRRDGTIHRLSCNENGLLRSYVYPKGGVRGLSKSSPCLDPVRNKLFYVRDDTVFMVKLDDETATEYEIIGMPSRWYGAFTHISPDGKILCAPCTDPRAFVDDADTQWEQMRKVPGRMEREKLLTRICLIDVSARTLKVAAEIPFWVTHVQFDPSGTGRIIFNREGFAGGGSSPFNRIWCLEPDGTHRPLSPEPPGEWRAHENWSADGKSIVYHGARDGKAFVASRTWDGGLVHETSLGDVEFWHATGARDGRRLFVDRPDGYVSVIDPSAGENRLINICRHDSSVEDQDAHPHPITTSGGESLIFTSIRTGNCNVYEVILPPSLSANQGSIQQDCSL